MLHFVNRHPGLRVADLLEILKITKQSLARVLKQLVDEGWIAQQAGERDRRERLLYADRQGRGPGAAGSTGCRPSAWREALEAGGPATRQIVRTSFSAMISAGRTAQSRLDQVAAAGR